jgi:hypothetical protein
VHLVTIMALTKQVQLKSNFEEISTFPTAYIKVEQVIADKLESEAVIAFYKEKDGLLVKGARYSFQTNLDGDNAIKQAYEYLKTLPEFTGAVDC